MTSTPPVEAEAQAEAEHPPADDEPSRPIVRLTKESTAKYRQEQAKLFAELVAQPGAYISPLSDESVQGYRTDEDPRRNGLVEIKELVTDQLRAAGIPCCLAAEAALIYYGAGRMLHDWTVCVASDQHDDAVALLTRTEKLQRFRRSAMTYTYNIDHHFPRFKFVGLRLFFVLMPSHAHHLDVRPDNIEFSGTGLPYPTLPVYAQSLLDAENGVDLDDLVDGMDLTLEWGEQYLDLTGTIDGEYKWWRTRLALNCSDDEQRPAASFNPAKRRDVWMKAVAAESKKMRQTWKYEPDSATRFRKIGSNDPRVQKRDYS